MRTRNYYLNDWMLLAPSVTADSFTQLDARCFAYCTMQRFTKLRIPRRWLRFLFSLHVHHHLQATAGLRAAALAGCDVMLYRSVRTRSRFGRACPMPRWCCHHSVHRSQCSQACQTTNVSCGRYRGAIACKANSRRCAADNKSAPAAVKRVSPLGDAGGDAFVGIGVDEGYITRACGHGHLHVW
jgi:hypothetical protein